VLFPPRSLLEQIQEAPFYLSFFSCSSAKRRRVFTTGGREKTTLRVYRVLLKIPSTRNSSARSTSYSHRASRPERGTPVALGKSPSHIPRLDKLGRSETPYNITAGVRRAGVYSRRKEVMFLLVEVPPQGGRST